MNRFITKGARSVGIAAAMMMVVAARAGILHVSQHSATPTPPYADWDTAAHVIQDAVALAVEGDTVLVGDGVYATGGGTADGAGTNRVCVTNGITVRSLNGPLLTTLSGGNVARCVWAAGGARIEGFTLLDGVAPRGGGAVVMDAFMSNCLVRNCRAPEGMGGGIHALRSTLDSLDIGDCWAEEGGGVALSGSALLRSRVVGNRTEYEGGIATHGGGVLVRNDSYFDLSVSLISDCLVFSNRTANGETYSGADGTSGGSGGGIGICSPCIVAGCEIVHNRTGDGAVLSSAPDGGATRGGDGGGLWVDDDISGPAIVSNCVVAGNACGRGGAGTARQEQVWDEDLQEWVWVTLPGQSADGGQGGGLWAATNTRIVACEFLDNRAGDGGPELDDGLGGLLSLPGNGGYGGGVHAGHNWWVARPGAVTMTNCLLAGNEAGRGGGVTQASDDGKGGGAYLARGGVAEECVFSNNWASAGGGAYSVERLSGCEFVQNSSLSGGGACVQIWSGQPAARVERCVFRFNTAESGGGLFIGGGDVVGCVFETNTATGANSTQGGGGIQAMTFQHNGTIRDCVLRGNRSARSGGGILGGSYFVIGCELAGNHATNRGGGLHTTGGTASNCSFTANTAGHGGGGLSMERSNWTLRDGQYGPRLPDAYEVQVHSNRASHGGGVFMDCGWLEGARIVGNTATNSGGGLFSSQNLYTGVVTRCALLDNLAGSGGGAYVHGSRFTVTDLLAAGNRADAQAGGLYLSSARLLHGSIVSNTSASHGGVFATGVATALNSIVFFNSAAVATDVGGDGVFLFCCATGLEGHPGCIAADPVFLDFAARDLRLASNSPCVDAATNLAAVLPDFAGLPRPLDGNADGIAIVDMGCHERLEPAADSDADGMPDGWEWDHGLQPTRAADAFEDADQDAAPNRDEYVADTDPHDVGSHLRLTSIAAAPSWTVSFAPASTGRWYSLQCATNGPGGGWSDVPGTAKRPGSGGQDAMTDTNAASVRFYRIVVELPPGL